MEMSNKPTKIFRIVNSGFCNVYHHYVVSIFNSIEPKKGDMFIARMHEYSQSLLTEMIQSRFGKEFDFRIDFLLNVYREFKCDKQGKKEVFSNLRDKRNEPLYFVDSGGLQLLRIRLGLIPGSVEEFERQIPDLIEQQEKLGDILFCLDYIPLWKRGEPIKKSDIISACYKTLEYINLQLENLEKKQSDSKLLPINQLTQLPPLGLIWFDIVKRELDFSNPHIFGYALTGLNMTGNKPTQFVMMHNISWLTKLQQEFYNQIGRPDLLTHILGMVSVPNEYFIYGLINGNFNHVSIDGVTYTKAYVNGYIWDFPFKPIRLAGFGEDFRKVLWNVVSMFSDIVDEFLGWNADDYFKLLREFHLEKKNSPEHRLAMYSMRMLFTYYQQIVAANYHLHRVEYIGNKFGKVYDKIKEEPDFYIHHFGKNMETIRLIDDKCEVHVHGCVDELL